jgi:hypothetical protein
VLGDADLARVRELLDVLVAHPRVRLVSLFEAARAHCASDPDVAAHFDREVVR